MKRFRTWISLLLVGSMVFLQGCSAGGSVPGSGSGTDGASGDKGDGASEQTEASMGRYVEEELELPEEIAFNSFPDGSIQLLDSGELAVVENSTGIYTSGDEGETWKSADAPWFSKLQDEANYIANLALAPNGAAAAIYTERSDEEDTVEETEEESDSSFSYKPLYRYISPDGNETELHYPDQENYINQFWFGKDSRLYGFSLSGKTYEVNPEDGSFRELFETDGIADYVCFTEKYMIVFATRCTMLYDLGNGALADEDTVLSRFVDEEIGDNMGGNADTYSVVAFEGEQEDVIYLAINKGLYRHAVGGNAMEQVIDGSLSSLGDPQKGLKGIVCLPESKFLILYNEMKLCRYTYDASIPTVPTEQISVYGLNEDYAIRQAVSLFQKKHPDVYVRYEVGMGDDSSMTAEDAIKNLNTRIMAGNGPDLLVLDGLPMKSYAEKGVLADLSGTVDGFTGEDSLFPNLVDAFRQDGKLYMLPVCFRLPLIEGDPEVVENVSDLATLADAMEGLREKNPEGNLLGLMTEDEVLHTLGMVSSSSWTDESGAIDKEALADFLGQARRIYQTEISGVDAATLAAYKNTQERWSNIAGAELYYAYASTSALDIAMEKQKVGVGIVARADFDFNNVTTLANKEDHFAYGSWQGQVANCFIPRTMVGVCTASEDNELAMEFFRFLFGRELQDIDLGGAGFPMNMASFETAKDNPRPDEQSSGIAISDEDGDVFNLEIKWMTEKDFAYLREQALAAVTPCMENGAIQQAVYEIGPKALNGGASVEETVAEIVKKAAIYLAE